MREAMAAHKAGRFPEAESGYRRVLAARPADPKAFYYLGLLHFHRDEIDAAIQNLRLCVQLAPNHGHAWNTLGGVLIAAGLRQEATQAYKRVTEVASGMGEGWYNLGICLRDEGRFEEAIASFRSSIARQPAYGKSYEALGMLLYQLERIPEAAEVYAAWTRQDPSNPIAKHMASAMSQRDVPERAADEYVRRLFDDSAKSFDADLRRLDYRAPALVAAALEEHAHGRILSEVLDAGCGTGLCGPLLRKLCRKLHGVDLSPQMIELARSRGCYDELDVAELSTFMRSKVNVLDAVISADTLVYFGDLEVPFKAARQALSPRGGVLIFTLESSRDGEPRDYRLEVHGRFTHSEDYVRRALQSSGLRLEKLTLEVLRKERGREVEGMLVVARKR